MRSRASFELVLLVGLLTSPLPVGADDLGAADDLDAAYEQEYDPWEGIERDGRVPKVELPDDLPNPERWRTIPAGRIKPGNFFQRFLVSSFVSPVIFRQEDVGWGIGVTAVDADFRHQRRQELASIFASYTTEGQQNYGVTWRRWLDHINLPEGGALQEERNYVSLRGGWSKTLTRRFYGIGPDSERDEQTRYTDARGVVQAGIQRTWPEAGSDFVWALGMRGEFHRLDDGRGDEADTSEAFPALFDRAEHTDMGFLNASIAWDTRDSQVNAYRGWEIAAAVSAPLLQTDWDVAGIFELRGSYVQPVWAIFHDGGDPGEDNPPTDVVALRARIDQLAGDVPFFVLPALGGSDDLRGFAGGRFRDRSLWAAGLEWRFWVIPRGFRIPFTEAVRVERVGLAPFFEAGSVADHVGRFADTRVRLSYGFSLLVALERAVPFRFNFGWSEEGFILSAGFGLDF